MRIRRSTWLFHSPQLCTAFRSGEEYCKGRSDLPRHLCDLGDNLVYTALSSSLRAALTQPITSPAPTPHQRAPTAVAQLASHCAHRHRTPDIRVECRHPSAADANPAAIDFNCLHSRCIAVTIAGYCYCSILRCYRKRKRTVPDTNSPTYLLLLFRFRFADLSLTGSA